MKALIRRYTLVNASMAAIFGLAMPVMSLAMLDKGLSLAQLGSLMAAFTVAAMLFEVPCGALADSWGRKRVFLLGEAIMLLTTLSFWLLSDFAWLMLAMALNGISRALISGTLDALMVQQYQAISGSQECGPDFLAAQAKIGGTSASVLGIACILGGFVPLLMALPSLQSGHALVGYYEINFVIMLPLILAHFGLTCKLINEQREHAPAASIWPTLRQSASLAKEALLVLRKVPLMLALIVLQIIGGAGLAAVEVFWQPRLAQLVDARNDSWMFGILCSISFLAMGYGHKFSIWLAKVLQEQYMKVLLLLQVAAAIGVALLALQQHVIGFFIAYTLLFLISGAMIAPGLTLFHTHADERLRSTLLSLKSLFQQAGALLGVLLASALAQSFDIGRAWLAAALLLLLGVLVFFLPALRKTAAAGSSVMASKIAAK